PRAVVRAISGVWRSSWGLVSPLLPSHPGIHGKQEGDAMSQYSTEPAGAAAYGTEPAFGTEGPTAGSGGGAATHKGKGAGPHQRPGRPPPTPGRRPHRRDRLGRALDRR